jgi:C4-dicarboxylate-specific signal transduction histidine kinase
MRDIRRVFAIGVSICDAALLKVTTRDLGEMVEVRVRDNGTGIAPKIRDRLFQPFVTTKPTGEGTGLGLSIARDIVTQYHRGTDRGGQRPRTTVRPPGGAHERQHLGCR